MTPSCNVRVSSGADLRQHALSETVDVIRVRLLADPSERLCDNVDSVPAWVSILTWLPTPDPVLQSFICHIREYNLTQVSTVHGRDFTSSYLETALGANLSDTGPYGKSAASSFRTSVHTHQTSTEHRHPFDLLEGLAVIAVRSGCARLSSS